MTALRKTEVIAELQTSILRMQGLKFSKNSSLDFALGPIKEAFPNASFPLGAVHEFLSEKKEDTASTSGFIAALLSSLMKDTGVSIWISSCRTVFPPSLKTFGVDPDRIIFLDLKKEKHVLWAIEEALKCEALAAVVGDMRELDFNSSRRLQLAVEQSQVAGFVLRNNYQGLNTTACVSRWKITTMPGDATDLPGVGFPKWKVELLRIRNGKPHRWDVQWVGGKFVHLDPTPQAHRESRILHAS